MSLSIGQVVGGYEVIGKLGAGGMGSVYKVRNVISERVDAMKVLLPDLSTSPDLAERFLQEIKVLASLRHPNIAALYTALHVENQLLMIMEFVDGITFEDRLRSGPPLGLEEGIAYITHVLSALTCAHSAGVVHRDIKPANIGIDQTGTAKLLDFGIARKGPNLGLTQAGTVIGSLFYMSPEQVRGQPVDNRSDLYSVGVILYRMVTGRRPFEGQTEFAVMEAHLNEAPTDPRYWNPTVPEHLAYTILRALAKDPSQRFQTADEFRVTLLPYLGATAMGTQPAPAKPAAPPAHHAAPPADQATVNTLERLLTLRLGPIASTLVRRHSRTTPSVHDLCTALSSEVPEGPDRTAFLQDCTRILGTAQSREAPTPTPTPTPTPASGRATVPHMLDPAVLDKAKRLLGVYVGPLARVIVDRAAARCRTEDELYHVLADEIQSPEDRNKFLQRK